MISALWEDRVPPKDSIGNYPDFLVYGKYAMLPLNIVFPSLQLSKVVLGETPGIENRFNTLLKLEEEREKARYKFLAHQC